MCNINILIAKNLSAPFKERDCISFIDATAASFVSNPDSEGVYFSYNNRLLKSLTRIRYYNELHSLLNSNIILSHARTATHGTVCKENTQPFMNNGFIIAHNGILQFRDKTIDPVFSDSYIFSKLFTKYMNIYSSDVKLSVNALFQNEINGGSYSIAIYDTFNDILYYFKNGSTSFYLINKNNSVFMTTNYNNIYLFNKLESDIIFLPNILYVWKYINNKLTMEREVLTIKSELIPPSSWHNFDYKESINSHYPNNWSDYYL